MWICGYSPELAASEYELCEYLHKQSLQTTGVAHGPSSHLFLRRHGGAAAAGAWRRGVHVGRIRGPHQRDLPHVAAGRSRSGKIVERRRAHRGRRRSHAPPGGAPLPAPRSWLRRRAALAVLLPLRPLDDVCGSRRTFSFILLKVSGFCVYTKIK